jgi:hypothetical protein
MLSVMRSMLGNGRVRPGGAGLLFSLLLLAACAVPAEVDRPIARPGTEMPMQSIIEAVLADAVEQTGLALDVLEVQSAEAVTWSDGSLGCPRPGMEYTQALVPGYRIKIRAGERILDYHANRRGYWILCPDGASQDPLPGAAEM